MATGLYFFRIKNEENHEIQILACQVILDKAKARAGNCKIAFIAEPENTRIAETAPPSAGNYCAVGKTRRKRGVMTRLEFLQVSRRYFKSRLKEKRSKKEIHNLKFALAGAEREIRFLLNR